MRDRPRAKALRCAIYTRKSSEEGLEQDFNSLQAQREACEAYIASQKHEGWRALPTGYDDGAYSGGTMERPALQRLLTDITAGLVDVVVVYKVDRLTRALTDFAKIVEVFDRNGVSFVSVTQQFNTTTSMGRLTLNVLLSFAQFEREVTGERIRDKIAASKKRGLWMGGFVPLGYRPDQRTLVIHETEAEIVRTIFRLYLQTSSVLKVQAELDRNGIVRPTSTTVTTNRSYGGRSFSRGEIYKILANPVYVGEIGHKGHRYDGQHPAIIDPQTWNEVRTRLAANTHARHIRRDAKDPSLLAGLLHDAAGFRLTPTHAVNKGKRYRYYALQPTDAQKRRRGRPHEADRRWRIAATEIEAIVIDRLATQFEDQHWLFTHGIFPSDAIGRRKSIIAQARLLAERLRSDKPSGVRELFLELMARVTLDEAEVRIDIRRSALMANLGLRDDEAVRGKVGVDAQPTNFASSLPASPAPFPSEIITVAIPIQIRRRGAETKLIIDAPGETGKARDPDPALVKMVANAHRWWDDLVARRFPTLRALARAYGKDERYVARVLPLAFLAPAAVETIMDGKQSVELTAQRLITIATPPHHWDGQTSLWASQSSTAPRGRKCARLPRAPYGV